MAIVTLAEARKQLNYADDDISDDDEIQAYVDSITAVVEDYKGETIEPATVVDELEIWPAYWWQFNKFRLWSPPVISLTSIVSWDGATTWNVADMRVANSTSGLVRIMRGQPVSGLVVVTYQAGYSVIPARYKRGALVILQHIWDTQRGVGLGAGGVIGPEELHERGLGGAGASFYPRKAVEILGPGRPVVA
jgi:hypothetical protein